MGLWSKWAKKNHPTEVGIHSSGSPTWQTNMPYDILGNDHVAHVQKKMDDLGFSENYEIVLPKPDELFIDYDSPELPEQFHIALDLLAQAYCQMRQCIMYKVTESMSGNRHVIVKLPPGYVFSNDAERVAWQAIFGSDIKREGLSMMSVVRGIKNPTLLIEKKGGAVVQTGVYVNSRPEPQGRKFRD